ncbi:MAG: hypothetical protein IPJ82_09595 [Lewinellaceae bacterium]|nr:hypothetical protein [Lewinellaceae bacterium]
MTTLNPAPDLDQGIRPADMPNFAAENTCPPFLSLQSIVTAMKHTIPFLCSLLLLGYTSGAFAQNDKALLRDLAGENQKSVEALALYPEDARLAILESCKYPELLVKMNNVREKTTAAFRTLIEDQSRADQEVFYELTRYPGLVEKIAGQQESPESVKQSLKQLPENQRNAAFGLTQREMRTLLKINELDHTARNAVENLIAAYPAPAKDAFRKLLQLPEVLELLNGDLRFAVLVGDVYREDPAWVIQKTDSLHLAVARAHAQELEDWKKEIENDPQAQQELETASREYAAENGYDSQDYPYDDLYDDGDAGSRVRDHYYYPWWFGYPWWYPDPCWQPYPYWYNWGFYPRYRTVVIIYLPSWHFMHWYFHHPRHHYHYTRLSTHFIHHYHGHRRSGTSISEGVGTWRDHNRAVISDEWLRDKERLPGRLKEFGRFEESRQDFNARNPKNPLSQEQFLEKNTKKYPELSAGREMVKAEIQREQTADKQERSKWAPAKEPVKTEPARAPKTQAPTPQTREPQEKTKVPQTEKPRTDPKKQRPIEDARDYHRNKWEETKREPAPKTQSAPQTQPAKPPAQKENKPRTTAPVKTDKKNRNR